jgi:hypothetical protein
MLLGVAKNFNLIAILIPAAAAPFWVKANIPQDANNTLPAGFFRMDFSSPEKREAKTARILDFAETLFNHSA